MLTAASETQAVEGTSSMEVVLAVGTTDKVVELQPSKAKAIQLLIIKANVYGSHLTYKVSDGTTDSNPVTVDAPQVFTGGNVILFGVDPYKLKFSNASTTDETTVQIFVARDVTP